jgi:hypothetical protein
MERRNVRGFCHRRIPSVANALVANSGDRHFDFRHAASTEPSLAADHLNENMIF